MNRANKERGKEKSEKEEQGEKTKWRGNKDMKNERIISLKQTVNGENIK